MIELLKDFHCVGKSKEGDVYSYGIILSEILSREDPYAEYDMEPIGTTILLNYCFAKSIFLRSIQQGLVQNFKRCSENIQLRFLEQYIKFLKQFVKKAD